MQWVWLTRIAGVLTKTMQFTPWNLLKTPTDSQYITSTVHRNQSTPKKNDNTFKKMVVENSCWTVLSSFPIVVVGLRHLAFNDSLSNSVSVRKSVPIRVQRFMHLSHMYDNVLVPYVYQFIHQKKLQLLCYLEMGMCFSFSAWSPVHPMFWNLFFEVDSA